MCVCVCYDLQISFFSDLVTLGNHGILLDVVFTFLDVLLIGCCSHEKHSLPNRR